MILPITTDRGLSLVFRCSVCAVGAVGSMMLVSAEGNPLPGGLTLPLALFALVFTDIRRTFSLSLFWTNLLGIVAFIAAFLEFNSDNIEARLLAGAHLLYYILWIVMFMPKTELQYWWICVMGILQVAVGSVLTSQGWYGLMLIIYMMLCVWTLAVFLVHKAMERKQWLGSDESLLAFRDGTTARGNPATGAVGDASMQSASANGSAAWSGPVSALIQNHWRYLLLAGITTLALRYDLFSMFLPDWLIPVVVFLICAAVVIQGFRVLKEFLVWSEADRPAAGGRFNSAGDRERGSTDSHSLFSPFRRPGTVRSSVHTDPGEPWVTWRFGLGLLLTVATSLLIGLIVFMLIPRVWIGQSPFAEVDKPMEAGRAVSGFTDVVQLGDFGQILESSATVMEVRLYNNDTGKRLDVEQYARSLGHDEPLFRGAALWLYQRGRWTSRSPQGGTYQLPRRSPGHGMVRQQYILHQSGGKYLFVMQPLYSCRVENSKRQPRMQVITSAVHFRRSGGDEATRYHVLSPSPGSGGRRFEPFRGLPEVARRTITMRDYLRMPPAGLERLIRQAAIVVTGDNTGISSLEDVAPAVKAQRLLAWLNDPAQFSYTLDTSIHDPAIDPVEDFLFNRRRGHCEYFATALTLMLRSVDVPARMVNGFKGGHLNSVNGSFEVQQRHAHSWVEAYVNDDWIVLDPTPAAGRQETVADAAPSLSGLADLRMTLNSLWNGMVLNVTLASQQQLIFGPLRNLMGDVQDAVARDAYNVPETANPSRKPRRSWNLQIGLILAAATIGLAIYAIRRWRHLLTMLSGWLTSLFRRSGRVDRGRLVEFYERYRRACQAQGFVRQESQTHREFAAAVDSQITARAGHNGLSGLPGEITDLFYRVRFGDVDLNPSEADRVDARLSQFEAALRESR